MESEWGVSKKWMRAEIERGNRRQKEEEEKSKGSFRPSYASSWVYSEEPEWGTRGL